jgi:hypothetical protein
VQLFGELDAAAADRFAKLALACIHREYPNKTGHHILASDQDARPPRELTPAFYGCFDWHSAVHGHWMLARLARLYPDTRFAAQARQALAKSLTPENLSREAEYMRAPGRDSFERPYGLAWLLQLAAELAEWDDSDAQQWSAALQPPVDIAVRSLEAWLPKLSHPVRSGEHSQSAFSLSLMLDYARSVVRSEFHTLLESTIRRLYLGDRDCPLAYEPSGEDFLSPCLAEANLVRRILDGRDFAVWLDGFLGSIPRDGSVWMEPVRPQDPTDPKLGHLDGLNLSRSWMLNGILSALPAGDQRIPALQKTAEQHADAGLQAVTSERYEGAHWLGTFAVYLLTKRGERQAVSTMR